MTSQWSQTFIPICKRTISVDLFTNIDIVFLQLPTWFAHTLDSFYVSIIKSVDILDHSQKPMPVSLKRDGPWVSDDEFEKDIAENLFNMWFGTGHYRYSTNKWLN